MIPGWVGWAELPMHAIPDGDVEATVSLSDLLIADLDADLEFLFEIQPGTDADPTGQVLRLSSRGFVTAGSDTPAQTPYRPRLLTPYNVQLEIPPPDGSGSLGSLAFGVIELENADLELDAEAEKSWEGRVATVKVGGTFDVGLAGETTLTYADYIEKLRGTVNSVGYGSDGRLIASLREGLALLDRPIQQNRYAGTGGLNGTDALLDQPRPLRYGACDNVLAIAVDPANGIYQLHDGAMEAVLAVRDRGVELTFDANVADITTATPGPGEYATSLATGYIKLGAAPADGGGAITADIRGDATGAVYVNTTSAIAKRIAVNKIGLSDPGDFEAASFNGFPNTRIIGVDVQGDVTGRDLLAQLFAGVDGWLAVSRTGRLRCGVYVDPSATGAVVSVDDSIINGIEDETQLPPIYRVEVRYGRTWHVQDKDALSDALSIEDRTLFSEPYRVVASETLSVKTLNKDARILVVDSFLANKVGAQELATKILLRTDTRRRHYRLRVERQTLERQPGDVVRVLSSRNGLSAGKNLYLYSVAEVGAERMNDWVAWG